MTTAPQHPSDDLPKAIKKQARAISEAAYAIELSRALRDLESHFAEWRSGSISCHELSRHIHQFHQGPSRELRERYSILKPHELAARAIATGLIPREDVPTAALEALAATIRAFEELEAHFGEGS